jgi:hypothetical protein
MRVETKDDGTSDSFDTAKFVIRAISDNHLPNAAPCPIVWLMAPLAGKSGSRVRLPQYPPHPSLA